MANLPKESKVLLAWTEDETLFVLCRLANQTIKTYYMRPFSIKWKEKA